MPNDDAKTGPADRTMGRIHLAAGAVFLLAALWLAWRTLDGAPFDRLMPVLLGILGLMALVDGLADMRTRRRRPR